MLLYKYTEEELRGFCKKHIETLESWLRRLIDEEMTQNFWENYFIEDKEKWWNIIKKSISDWVRSRFNTNKWQYKKLIDATFFEDLISIVGNTENDFIFNKYFKNAYPNWSNEIKYFLWKLKNIRNKLYHVNPISIREAEQVVCYSNDIIESFKIAYKNNNMETEYNAPKFIRSIDSFGNEENFLNDCNFDYRKNDCNFRPWDILSIEVFVDATFDPSDYKIQWKSNFKEISEWSKLELKITDEMINSYFMIDCFVISNKKWHRHWFYDDSISFIYQVLPPIWE